ncbi:MAG: flavodoxin [Ruminococcaceae bacterium]|nr:flavodoxin [Oscillospiraceae bacterium]
MNTVVVYKSKYGSTKKYAEWIAEELKCDIFDMKNITVDFLLKYDVIIYGGGLYAEIINGLYIITKNFDKFKDKKIVVFTTGITPLDVRDYYDKLVYEKNFKTDETRKIKVFNFLGKMILEELSPVHRTAIKGLKKIMSLKENPTDMEKLLIKLCDANGDFSDKEAIFELIKYVKGE